MTVAAQTETQRDEYGRGAEKWVPRVGDRVRLTKDGLSTTGAVGKLAMIERIGFSSAPYLLKIDGPVNYKTVAITPEFTCASIDGIELASTERPKFKVGDRVRVSTLRHGEAQHGKIGTIVDTQFPSKTLPIEISYDEPMPSGFRKNQYSGSDLEPLLEPTAIVALIENGQPKPNKQPKIHTDKADATTEAERLALKYPGQKFGVFVLADTRIADIVTTKTAVLRAA